MFSNNSFEKSTDRFFTRKRHESRDFNSSTEVTRAKSNIVNGLLAAAVLLILFIGIPVAILASTGGLN